MSKSSAIKRNPRGEGDLAGIWRDERIISLTYLGTTGSSSPFLASAASFHRAVQRHHLQPGSRPILRRLLPREAEKSRNSRVRRPIVVVRDKENVSILSQKKEEGKKKNRQGGRACLLF